MPQRTHFLVRWRMLAMMYGLIMLREYLDEILDGTKTYDARTYIMWINSFSRYKEIFHYWYS